MPGLVISLIIAEIFYKFGSFSLECVAFPGTWFLIDLIIEVIANKFAEQSRKNQAKSPQQKKLVNCRCLKPAGQIEIRCDFGWFCCRLMQ